MTLILNNDEIEQLLTMEELVPVLEDAYVELVEGRGGNRRRSDIVTPTPGHKDGLYALKSMDGVIPKFGIGAVRINSDILTFPKDGGVMRRVKYPAAPGERYVGLVLLFSTETCEPLIICPDGVMQRMRVGATNAIASKHLARKDAGTVAILGSGWQADAQLVALDAVHELDDIRVYSPRKDRRLVFAQAMSAKLGKTVRACDTAEEACRGADVVNCSTNATTPVFFKEWLEPGMHVGAIRPGASEVSRDAWPDIDVIALLDHDDAAELIYTHGVQVGEDREGGGYNMEHDDVHASWPSLPQIITGRHEGRTDDGQITMFLNNLGLGYQFAAAGYVLYKRAKGSGLGNELPTEWFTELEHP